MSTDDTAPQTEQPAGADDSIGASLGHQLGERMRPLRARRAALVGRLHGGPGNLLRRSRSFSSAAGLSLSSRQQLGLAVPDLPVQGLPVAPPAEWDESIFAPERPRTGNATLDRIIASQSRQRSKPAAPRRGLLATSGRRNTPIGRNTAPGGFARRLSPQAAPGALDLDVRRVVSGDGGDTRPRAPGRGSGARSGARPDGRPDRGSAGRPSRPPGRGAGRHARGRPGRPVPWPEHPSAHLTRLSQTAGPPAASGAGPIDAESAGADPAPPPLAEQVAELADEVLGPTATSALGGMVLPRSMGSLPPAMAAPTSRSRPPVGSGAASATAPGGHGTGHGSPADLLSRLAAVGQGPATGSLPVGPDPMAGVSMTSVASAMPVTGSPATSPSPPSGRGRVTPTSRRVPARSPRRFDRSDSPASPSVPGSAMAEPALAASLRAGPPAISLSAPPARSFAVTGASGGAGRPVPGAATASGQFPPLADLPVAPGGVITPGAVDPGVFDPGSASAARPGRAPRSRPSRGLGTVASIIAPSGSSTGPASRRPGSVPGDPAQARRAVRRLPDLGSVAPAILAPTPGASPSLAATPHSSPRARPADPLQPSSSPSVGVPPAGTPSVAPAASMAPQPVAPPAVVPTDPGERFDHELRQQRSTPPPRRLPQRFEPMARAIGARPDRVRVSTDPRSRQALASVGKVAATSGEVVHLARRLDDTPRTAEILAHELHHVANPSPLVRFFADDRHSAEERVANEVGKVMSQSPVGSPPASPPPAPPPPPGGQGGGGSGAGSRSGNNGQGRSGGLDVNQGPPSPPAAPPGVLPPEISAAEADPAGGGRSGAGRTGGSQPQADATAIDIDRLLDALETRVIRELERRGRRWPRPM